VAGADHTCLLSGSVVWCWGMNNKGQLGDGTTTNHNIPARVLDGAASITAGSDYTCAGLRTGGVMCWGNNAEGQLADGTKTNHTAPTLASLITNASGVDAGQHQTCALSPSHLITCWSGGLIPVTGGVPEEHTQVSVSRFGALVVGVDRQGVPVMIDASGATQVSGLSGAVQVDSGVNHVCAMLAGGSVKCWGANSYGQLGNNSTVDSKSPVSVANLHAASDLAVGRNHACVIATATTTDTLIECWGLNASGQLGNGSNINSSVPVEVPVTR
jgi:alpha-tubulin suppressor-like RCC1 family protein